jgi:hypothetical protein
MALAENDSGNIGRQRKVELKHSIFVVVSLTKIQRKEEGQRL